MNYLALKKMENIINNQIRLKETNLTKKNIINKISINFNYKQLDSFKNPKILESLFYLKLITNKKSYISFLKKKYKSIDLNLNIDLIKKEKFFLISL